MLSEFFCFVVFGSQTDYSLIWIINKLNHSLFLLVPACTSGEFLNGFSGFFSTTKFPSNFPQYSRCTWNITVPSGYIIKLSFLYFRLEPNQYVYSPCYYDAPGARVTVRNGASDDGYEPFTLCGQSLPPPVYSVGNTVQVIFTSLSSQYPGFNATYTAITYSSGTWYTLFIRHNDWVKINKNITNNNSPWAWSKKVLDSGLNAVNSGLQELDSGCQW